MDRVLRKPRVRDDDHGKPRAASADISVSGSLPTCIGCGGQLSFAGGASGAIEWWRCVECTRSYPVRRAAGAGLPTASAAPDCAHRPPVAARCAVCGKGAVAITLVSTWPGRELTAYFCSLACV